MRSSCNILAMPVAIMTLTTFTWAPDSAPVMSVVSVAPRKLRRLVAVGVWVLKAVGLWGR